VIPTVSSEPALWPTLSNPVSPVALVASKVLNAAVVIPVVVLIPIVLTLNICPSLSDVGPRPVMIPTFGPLEYETYCPVDRPTAQPFGLPVAVHDKMFVQ